MNLLPTSAPFVPTLRLRDVVREYPDVTACAEVMDALNNPRPAGTMRDWMILYHGRPVTTIQVSLGSVWSPTARIIDADTYASYVSFPHEGQTLQAASRREYRGFRVIHAGSRCLVVHSADEAIAYVLED